MHIVSTVTKTQATDVPVVLITLDGNRKFLPRPETYEAMDRLVREHYQVDSHAGLKFEVSCWDVCAGQSVEVTEAAYPLLVPLLDSVSVVVVQGGRHRAMPTPSATPSLREDEIEDSDEQAVREHLAAAPEPSSGRATESPPRRAPKVESEDDEEVFVGSRYCSDADRSVSLHDDDDEEEDEEEEDAPHARQVLSKEFPSAKRRAKSRVVPDDEDELEEEVPSAHQVVRKEVASERKQAKGKVVQGDEDEREPPAPARIVKQEPLGEKPQVKPLRTTPKPHAESSKAAAAAKSREPTNRPDDTAESSRVASVKDERFKVYISGPRPEHKAEFMTRGGHVVRKVLAGACKTFDLDLEHAKLMVCTPIPNDDGVIEMAQFECEKGETIARSGVVPNSKLVVRIEYGDEDEDED
ncbi:hypothetical protein K438DRAFT_1830690 [Mycena galopus ATCC 62051]|nr:hypothetical protein K438DRAFT_1830690 [Mycena galopus ATCC 62051]